MAKSDFISAERLRQAFEYNPETGEFTRKFCNRRRYNKQGKVGHLSSAGYVQMYFDGVNTRAHRLAWLYVYGQHPVGQIDHINGNKADNRICNLRDVSGAINMQNRDRSPAENKTGATGVSHFKGGFRVEIDSNGSRFHLGIYETIEEAKAAYNAGRLILHRKAIER